MSTNKSRPSVESYTSARPEVVSVQDQAMNRAVELAVGAIYHLFPDLFQPAAETTPAVQQFSETTTMPNQSGNNPYEFTPPVAQASEALASVTPLIPESGVTAGADDLNSEISDMRKRAEEARYNIRLANEAA